MCSPAILHVPFELVESDASRAGIEEWLTTHFEDFGVDLDANETNQDCIYILPVDYKGKWKTWRRLLLDLVTSPGISIQEWSGYVAFKKGNGDEYINFRVYQDGERDWEIELTKDVQGSNIYGEYSEERRFVMGYPPQDPDGFVAAEEEQPNVVDE